MQDSLQDPKIDLVRAPFLEGLSRLCLLLALGNFLCIAPLYLILQYNQQASQLFVHYTVVLTAVGVTLTVLGVLCRYKNLGSIIPKICMGILFVQPCYLLIQVQTLNHPIVMLFPILCFLVTPILGKNSSYYIAALSIGAILGIHYFSFSSPVGLANLSSVGLISLGIFFSAYVSSVLWKSVLHREGRLKTALSEVRKKSDQIDAWAHQFASASALINEGSISLSLPEPPPYRAFAELSHQVEEMQKKLGRHFGQMVMQDRINSLGVLASGLAHELNTPLTSIEFLLEAHSAKLPTEFKEELRGEINRMAGITRGFLTFASPHQQDSVCDLNEILQICVPLLKRSVRQEIEIILDLAKEPVPVRAVKAQIEQIVLNLFKNAADSMTETATPRFEIQTRCLNSVPLLVLRDNGSGIPKDILPKVFDPFFTTKEPGHGVGLGLYLVQEILKSHDATIHIETADKLGTTIKIQFPKAEARKERKAA